MKNSMYMLYLQAAEFGRVMPIPRPLLPIYQPDNDPTSLQDRENRLRNEAIRDDVKHVRKILVDRPPLGREAVNKAFIEAARAGSIDVVNFFLFYHSSRGDLINIDFDIDCRDSAGNTPLMVAVEKGNLNVVRFLLGRANMTLINNAGKNVFEILRDARRDWSPPDTREQYRKIDNLLEIWANVTVAEPVQNRVVAPRRLIQQQEGQPGDFERAQTESLQQQEQSSDDYSWLQKKIGELKANGIELPTEEIPLTKRRHPAYALKDAPNNAEDQFKTLKDDHYTDAEALKILLNYFHGEDPLNRPEEDSQAASSSSITGAQGSSENK